MALYHSSKSAKDLLLLIGPADDGNPVLWTPRRCLTDICCILPFWFAPQYRDNSLTVGEIVTFKPHFEYLQCERDRLIKKQLFRQEMLP